MCGIVAIVARTPQRSAPAGADLLSRLALANDELECLCVPGTPAEMDRQLEALAAAEAYLVAVDRMLKGVPGIACLLREPGLAEVVRQGISKAGAAISRFEAELDEGGHALESDVTEKFNAAVVHLRDATWAVAHDRLGAANSVGSLATALRLGTAHGPPNLAALTVLWSVHAALCSLDRLEVRGRDSAGLHLMLVGHGLSPKDPDVRSILRSRLDDPLFSSLGARLSGPCLSLVYKTAKPIGELGDNVAALRESICGDPILSLALAAPDVRVTVVGHTRWASVGVISQPNAHPLNSDSSGTAGPYVIGALNGDIDNYAQLVASEALSFPSEVTTDAKLVPALVSRALAAGGSLGEAFRGAVELFDGSVGIAVNSALSPDEILLALRGSGQSLNIGLAEDAFVIASEPYGLVEETSSYVRMEGEGGGQVITCCRDEAGSLAGLARWRYSGEDLPLTGSDVMTAEITTRDVDRKGYKHFLLKEISEAPGSVRKTLRGKLSTAANGDLCVRLGDDVVPRALRQALASGVIREIAVIGQGTAAVAGQAVANAISRALPWPRVRAMPATELSGWGLAGAGLPDEMSAVLVVAISQSGTTTDTNRTVDLCRARGAHIVCIVNRRNSDLVEKSHGVLYTSDGRDVEMSVASTKAFYSQVVAGHLLAAGLAAAAMGDGHRDGASTGMGPGTSPGGAVVDVGILAGLRALPDLMDRVLASRGHISRVAAAVAPPRRSWAIVGSGPDKVAAAEVRIKLSELCYKAIALDSIEDKKHIDLSAEPLLLVCAPSVRGANARDIAKEIEIFRAHKAAPVVIAAEGQEELFSVAVDVLPVPPSHPELAFLLAAMVGHIFGYEAALSIDGQALPLREARAILEEALAGAAHPDAGAKPPGAFSLEELAPSLEAATAPALAGLRAGAYDGHLNASTASRLTSLLRYATGALPIEGYEAEMGRVGTPAAVAADLVDSLGAAIDELTRPIDAIKHQAKTVTVGISRSEEPLLRAKLVVEALAAGASVDSFGYRALRTLAALGPAVEEVVGYTRYRVGTGAAGDLGDATIAVVDRGGIAAGITSRTSSDSRLRGTKHRAAQKREVTVFRGQRDGRTGIMVPEVKGSQVTGMTLLHARFAEHLPSDVAGPVLQAYQGRYAALVDAVTEVNPQFDDAVLGAIGVVDLLTEPVALLARHWAPGRG